MFHFEKYARGNKTPAAVASMDPDLVASAVTLPENSDEFALAMEYEKVWDRVEISCSS